MKRVHIPVEILGTDTDQAIAERYGVHAVTVTRMRAKHNVDRYRVVDRIDRSRLGVDTDQTVADASKVSRGTVFHFRVGLGIPPRQKSQIDTLHYRDLLGTMSDSELARQLGVSQQAIHNARVRRGIPCWKR